MLPSKSIITETSKKEESTAALTASTATPLLDRAPENNSFFGYLFGSCCSCFDAGRVIEPARKTPENNRMVAPGFPTAHIIRY